MNDTTIKKIESKHSPTGEMGQKYLASGVNIAMRLWEAVGPDIQLEERVRDYETVGYVLNGRAKLHSEQQTVILEAGDSWIVPSGAHHRYEIIEPFTAVEATHPPAHAASPKSTG